MITWEIELKIERSRRMKISLRIETRFRFIYHHSFNNLIFRGILALIQLDTLIKLPILQTIFISAIMNVDFIPNFIQE